MTADQDGLVRALYAGFGEVVQWGGICELDLSDADLSGANLSDADLSDADLNGANLAGKPYKSEVCR